MEKETLEMTDIWQSPFHITHCAEKSDLDIFPFVTVITGIFLFSFLEINIVDFFFLIVE